MTAQDDPEYAPDGGSDINIDKGRLAEVANAFASWLLISGYSPSTIPARKGAFRAAIQRMGSLPDDLPEGLVGSHEFAAAISTAPDWQRPISANMTSLFKSFANDVAELSMARVFSFTEINPGLGAMGLAAKEAGGIPNGSELSTPISQPAYEYNFGRGSLEPATTPVQIVLANLPFSAFLTEGSEDPEVVEIVDATKKHLKTAKAFIFRVDWTVGERLDLSVDGYVRLIAARLKGWDVHTTKLDNYRFTPMEGSELFIVAAKRWLSDFRPVAAGHQRPQGKAILQSIDSNVFISPDELPRRNLFPANDAKRIDADYWHDPSAAVVSTKSGDRMLLPVEIASLLGISGTYTLPADAETSYHLLGGSVVVPLAERVIRGVLRSVELD